MEIRSFRDIELCSVIELYRRSEGRTTSIISVNKNTRRPYDGGSTHL
jgi:hypothetical protein